MSGDPTHLARSDGSSHLWISKKQRDVLFERIVRNLARVDDLLLALQSGDFEAAERLGRNLHHEVSLVTNDLRWGAHGEGCSIEVSTPPLILRSVLERLRDEAKALDPHIDLRDDAAENRELIATCEQLLDLVQTQSRKRSSGCSCDRIPTSSDTR